jgi:phosphate transport system permease protein
VYEIGTQRRLIAAGASDRATALAVWCGAAMVVGLFLWIVGDVVWNGIGGVSFAFLTETPRAAGREGGIGPVIVSTLWILAVCLIVAVPLGTGTAVLLAEYAHGSRRFAAIVRRSLDVLAGVPSIVFGLFGNAFFCVTLGLGFSILSGGLTLACMALPLLIRATEEGLRAVPDDIRTGAAALGMTRARTLVSLLLPCAMPGLVVGIVLGVGRALAETAALIFTSGYVDRTPESLFDSGRSLSIHIYELSMNVAGAEHNAYASAVVLLMLLLAINASTFGLTERWLRRRMAKA